MATPQAGSLPGSVLHKARASTIPTLRQIFVAILFDAKNVGVLYDGSGNTLGVSYTSGYYLAFESPCIVT